MLHLFPPSGPLREIENHYHLQMVAENTGSIIQYQQRAFELQREAAIEGLRGMTDALGQGFNQLAEGLGLLNATAEGILDAVDEQTRIIEAGFAAIADLMVEQHETLQEMTRVLRSPYETKAQELLREAERAIKSGMQASGRNQQEEFKDALRLFTEVLNNPIGSRDFVAWFHVGWLKWKCQNNLAEAAEAFYHAERLSATQDIEEVSLCLVGCSGNRKWERLIEAVMELTGRRREEIPYWVDDPEFAEDEEFEDDFEDKPRSPILLKERVQRPIAEKIVGRLKKLGGMVRMNAFPPRKNPLYVESIWHHAYMQDCLGQFEDAYNTIQKALHVTPTNTMVLKDAARYAAKTNRVPEAIALLEKCIELRPEIIVTLSSETDFSSINKEVLSLLTRRIQQARKKAEYELRELLTLITAIKRAGDERHHSIILPEEITEIQKRLSCSRQYDYLTALAESRVAKEHRETVLETAKLRVWEIKNRRKPSEIIQSKIDHLRLLHAQAKWARAWGWWMWWKKETWEQEIEDIETSLAKFERQLLSVKAKEKDARALMDWLQDMESAESSAFRSLEAHRSRQR